MLVDYRGNHPTSSRMKRSPLHTIAQINVKGDMVGSTTRSGIRNVSVINIPWQTTETFLAVSGRTCTTQDETDDTPSPESADDTFFRLLRLL